MSEWMRKSGSGRLGIGRALLALAAPLAIWLSASVPAQAALPFGTLGFVQPTGVAHPNDVIDIRMVFTLDPSSSPLDFSSNPLTGFDPEDLPTQGFYFNPDTGMDELRDFAEVTGAYLNTFFTCTGTFTEGCSEGTNYSFEFWLSSTPGNPSLNFLESFALAPGASTEYLFGRFVPVPAGAAPGNYIWHNTGLTLNFRGVDADGNALDSYAFHNLGQSCPSIEASCAFTRTVVEVPEPETWAMMALGLLAVAAKLRRRRR